MINVKKLYIYNDIKYVDKTLYQYIKNNYFNDIYSVFFNSIQHIQKQLNIRKLQNFTKPLCCVLDLDETFFQNDSFLYNTLHIWKYNNDLYNYYKSTKFINKSFGPILPFMYILYSYLIQKNIQIIFLSGRHEKFRQLTIDNLNFFNIDKKNYKLILNNTTIPSYLYKQYYIKKISNDYDIILCLNDQNEFSHKNLIQTPQIYNI